MTRGEARVAVILSLAWVSACSSSDTTSGDTNDAGKIDTAGTAGADGGSGGSGASSGTMSTGGSGGSLGGSPAEGGNDDGGSDAGVGGSGGTPIVMGNLTFMRKTLHTFNYGEGIGVADFNNDGKLDVSSGPFWWDGPTFATQHEIFLPPANNALDGMSLADWADYAYDVDGDGWVDSINIMRPSTPSYWYKNPGAGAIDQQFSPWEQHELGTLVLEQSMFTDISGEGQPDLVGAIDSKFGWFDVGGAGAWAFNTIGPSGATNAYAWWHGIGTGDLNGDGRQDLLTDSGWYEHPAGDPRTDAWVKHPQRFKGDGVSDEHGPSHMYGYDVDGDGDEDVITALDSHAYGVAWYENDAGTFTPHVIVGGEGSMATNAGMIPPFSQPHALVVADVDGDGLKDIVTGKSFYAHPPGMGDPDADGTPVFYVFKLVREGTSVSWEPHLVDSEVGLGRQFTTADLNGDGKVDIPVASKHGVFLFFQQ